jgi:hypothetical protein
MAKMIHRIEVSCERISKGALFAVVRKQVLLGEAKLAVERYEIEAAEDIAFTLARLKIAVEGITFAVVCRGKVEVSSKRSEVSSIERALFVVVRMTLIAEGSAFAVVMFKLSAEMAKLTERKRHRLQ